MLSLALLAFGGFSWYNALSGQTTIEKKGRETGHKGGNYNFGDADWRVNLYVVFGTKSLWRALLPSIRPIPVNLKYKAIPSDLLTEINQYQPVQGQDFDED